MRIYSKALLIGGLCLAISNLALAESESKYYGQHLCAYPNFTCVNIKSGDTWSKLFPNPRHREMVKRLNRTNMSLRYRSWIVVPTNLNQISYKTLSPFADYIQPQGGRVILVNLRLQAFGAYNAKGNLVHWGPISGGKGYCSDIKKPCYTYTGSFKIVQKKGAACESSKFPIETSGGAPMPYCMHYFRGFALHASTLPGYHASHGCVRLFYDDAKWLNKKFIRVGATRVVVTRD